jgi:hypothetical protein
LKELPGPGCVGVGSARTSNEAARAKRVSKGIIVKVGFEKKNGQRVSPKFFKKKAKSERNH